MAPVSVPDAIAFPVQLKGPSDGLSEQHRERLVAEGVALGDGRPALGGAGQLLELPGQQTAVAQALGGHVGRQGDPRWTEGAGPRVRLDEVWGIPASQEARVLAGVDVD